MSFCVSYAVACVKFKIKYDSTKINIANKPDIKSLILTVNVSGAGVSNCGVRLRIIYHRRFFLRSSIASVKSSMSSLSPPSAVLTDLSN